MKFSGRSDLRAQTIDADLIVTLPIGSNLPWVAALAGGLPAAAGVYVASRIFEDQLGKFSSAIYKVSGKLDDPAVEFVKVFDTEDGQDDKRGAPAAGEPVPDAASPAADPDRAARAGAGAAVSGVRVAAVQMVSGEDVGQNLERARALIATRGRPAAHAWWCCPRPSRATAAPTWARSRWRSAIPADRCAAFSRRSRASTASCWSAAPSRWLAMRPGNARTRRASCYAEDGSELARYDKIHLFDVELPDAQRCYRESDSYAPGEQLVCAPTACGMLGLGVCYDLRFPEMFRALGQRGMDVLALPSAFTRVTGAAHWHVLLRARAIENQVYVIAPDQGGRHSATRETWGGSAIIDPWGRVLASAASGEAVIVAEVDAALLRDVRERLPVRAHQRFYVPGGDSSARRTR